MTYTFITFGVLAVLLLMTIVIYNRLVGLQQGRKNAFSDIDVQLRLRYDLIPNLVNTVKGYASHEKTVLTDITEARASVGRAQTDSERVSSENMLSESLMKLFAVAENYPQLKANDNFKALQLELSDIENKISAARRFFNSATAEYNTAVIQFPANVVASVTGFQKELYFENTNINQTDLEKGQVVTF